MLRQILFCILFFIIAISGYAQKQDTYTLNFNLDQPDVIFVEAKLHLEDSLLYMTEYGPMPEKFPQYIEKLKISDEDGHLLSYRFKDSLAWIIEGVERGEEVTLNYEMHLDHELEQWPGGTDGVAYKRDYGVMTSGRALFIMNGASKEDIQVKTELPVNYRISTPWKYSSNPDRVFSVPDLENLQESFLFIGRQEEFEIERDSFKLIFVIGGKKLNSEKERLVSVANKLLDYYIELMGGIPVSSEGNPLDRSMVIITENDNTDGEVIGNHISMFMNPDAEMQSQIIGWFIFAHEFFHLWNGKTIKFKDTRSDWFKEGVSNYYTLKGLTQTDFINEEAFKGVLNELFYNRYINDPGLGQETPVNSADSFSKDQHWGLIYGGGLFAGISADLEIRQETFNKKSLDDLMRLLYEEYGGKDKYVDNSYLIRMISQLGFEDFPEFFVNYLEGTKTISLQPHLIHAGIEVEQNDSELILRFLEDRTVLQQNIWEGVLGKIKPIKN